MIEQKRTAYDAIEYPSKPFLQHHPARLETMARLFGLKPAPAARARVLEFGCGDGLNLIAAALVLPQSEFHGVDLSESATTRGREMARKLGLANVRIEQGDLRAGAPAPGHYDYVVAHGLYSWVPDEVREALMSAMAHALHPEGVAFVSYNAYPGAYLRRMVREMAAISAGADIAHARRWLEGALDLPAAPPIYRAVVADEARDILRREDGALFHDDLNPLNRAFYFRDFIAHAATHGLQYLSEADLASTALPHEDRIAAEQEADFRKGRRFRQTLLCHAARKVRPAPNPGALKGCWFGGPVEPGQPADGREFHYRTRTGASHRTADVERRCILETAAAAWPAYTEVAELGPAFHPAILALFASDMLDVRSEPPPAAAEIAPRPEVSPLARLQAANGESLTTLHHMEIRIDDPALRRIIERADGTRTLNQLSRSRNLPEHLESLRQSGLLLAPTELS